MILKIDAVDKIIIPMFFPRQDSILVQMMARDIGRKIELTDKDRETIELKPNSQGQGVIWSKEKVSETEIEVEFTNTEISMLQERIQSLDKQKDIAPGMVDTCIKIREVKVNNEK